MLNTDGFRVEDASDETIVLQPRGVDEIEGHFIIEEMHVIETHVMWCLNHFGDDRGRCCLAASNATGLCFLGWMAAKACPAALPVIFNGSIVSNPISSYLCYDEGPESCDRHVIPAMRRVEDNLSNCIL